MSKNVYLDANGGIEMSKESLKLYNRAAELTNPSNVNAQSGRISEQIYESAMGYIKASVASPKDVLLSMSCGTEANASVIYSVGQNYPNGHFVVTGDSHPSIYDALTAYKCDFTRVEAEIDTILTAVTDRTIMVIFPHVASLSGAINPTRKWSRAIKQKDDMITVLCDATQAVGRLSVNRTALGVDYMTFSAHKFGGPKGVGFAVIGYGATRRKDLVWKPLIPGSQQEGMRGGTYNVSGVVATAAALKYQLNHLKAQRKNVIALTKGLYRSLSEIPNIRIENVNEEEDIEAMLGNTLLIAVPVCSKRLAHELSIRGYDVGTGCACQSAKDSNHIRVSIPFDCAESLDNFAPIFGELLEGMEKDHLPKRAVEVESGFNGTIAANEELTEEQAKWVAEKLSVDIDAIPDKGIKTWMYAINVEREHDLPPRGLDNTNVTDGDLVAIAKIALRHILEIPDYYVRLEQLEKEGEAHWKGKKRPAILKGSSTL